MVTSIMMAFFGMLIGSGFCLENTVDSAGSILRVVPLLRSPSTLLKLISYFFMQSRSKVIQKYKGYN